MKTNDSPKHKNPQTKWRVWPLFLLWALVPLCFVPEMIYPGVENAMMVRFMGPGLISVLILIWWAFLSRASVIDRALTTVSVLVIAGTTIAYLDPSMLGPAMIVLTIPIGIGLFSVSNLLLSYKPFIVRSAGVLTLTAIGFFSSLLIRSEGLWGGTGLFDIRWRFSEKAEDKLANTNTDLTKPATFSKDEIEKWLNEPQWPGFRGPKQDGIIRNLKISDDWQTNPPKEIWSRDAGLGWSSFAVAGNLLITQEQRGKNECVVCYDTKTGKEIWLHSILSRFEEYLGGVGPRATPTIAEGDIFNLGANGHLSRINGLTGENKWTVDIKQEKFAGRQPSTWGFCSSPLVHKGKVIVHAGGAENKGTLAFNTEDGTLAWSSPSGDHSYSSPQNVNLLGTHYIAMSSNTGLDLLNPDTGDRVFHYEWKKEGYRTPQPVNYQNDSIILAGESGTRILTFQLNEESKKLKVAKETKGKNFRPDFNDFVVHGNFAYGFSMAKFKSINLKDGTVSKKRERYGKGQVISIQDSELLIVLTESGQLALLEFDGLDFEEIGRIDALNDRTWNHPVVVDGKLFVRNAKQIKCFQLHSPENRSKDE